MSSNLKTTEEGMQYALGQFNEKDDEFRKIMSNVVSAWTAMHASYQGDSALAFDRGVKEWTDQFNVVIQNLTQMEEKLRSTIGLYKAAEEEATHNAGQFTGGLPSFAI
ncbi:MAG: hypothetical protein QOE51_5042 [Actinoplanes sp.]|jgi:WXG100 family type VII secretion target|nr:hypothetical protein [Actinoplanes sp.]